MVRAANSPRQAGPGLMQGARAPGSPATSTTGLSWSQDGTDYPVALVQLGQTRAPGGPEKTRVEMSTSWAMPPTCTACLGTPPAKSPPYGWVTAVWPTAGSARPADASGLQEAGRPRRSWRASPCSPRPQWPPRHPDRQPRASGGWRCGPADESGWVIDKPSTDEQIWPPPGAGPRRGRIVFASPLGGRRRRARRTCGTEQSAGPARSPVATITGNGLKDPDRARGRLPAPVIVPSTAARRPPR